MASALHKIKLLKKTIKTNRTNGCKISYSIGNVSWRFDGVISLLHCILQGKFCNSSRKGREHYSVPNRYQRVKEYCFVK